MATGQPMLDQSITAPDFISSEWPQHSFWGTFQDIVPAFCGRAGSSLPFINSLRMPTGSLKSCWTDHKNLKLKSNLCRKKMTPEQLTQPIDFFRSASSPEPECLMQRPSSRTAERLQPGLWKGCHRSCQPCGRRHHWRLEQYQRGGLQILGRGCRPHSPRQRPGFCAASEGAILGASTGLMAFDNSSLVARSFHAWTLPRLMRLSCILSRLLRWNLSQTMIITLFSILGCRDGMGDAIQRTFKAEDMLKARNGFVFADKGWDGKGWGQHQGGSKIEAEGKARHRGSLSSESPQPSIQACQ